MGDKIFFVTRNTVSAENSNQIGYRNHQITQRQENNRPFGISKTVRVDSKRQGRKQTGHCAQYRPHCYPDLCSVLLFRIPERVTRHPTVLHHSVADFYGIHLIAALRSLFVDICIVLKLLRTNKTDVVTAGTVGILLVARGPVSEHGHCQVYAAAGKVHRLGRLGRGRGVVLADAQRTVRELGALQVFWPINMETVHDGLAAVARGHTQGPTGRYGRGHNGAHRRKYGAQEELQVVRTLDLHQRIVLLHLESRLVLPVLAQQIGHDGLVVCDAHAERNGDLLAAAVRHAGRVFADRRLLELLAGRAAGRGGGQREREHQRSQHRRHHRGHHGRDRRAQADEDRSAATALPHMTRVRYRHLGNYGCCPESDGEYGCQQPTIVYGRAITVPGGGRDVLGPENGERTGETTDGGDAKMRVKIFGEKRPL